MGSDFKRTMFATLLIVVIATLTGAQVLDPPYFNLAEGRTILATATCGEGVAEPELYCKLVGATLDLQDNPNINLIQGQVCDYCDPTDPKMSHPAEFAIDGTERWWQSPPLSRGNKFNEVNLTIDLGQEFHVAYVFIKMANSPRPGLWVLERSTDDGKTYEPWQYFAESPGDCVHHFGKDTLQPILKDDSVICESKFSKVVPLEGGEIVVSLLNGRPSADNFSHSMELQEWTKATNIRLRLVRTKNLLGHLMSVARQDPTVTRRYFYSIKDINIGGRCVCNGHAETCDITDPNNPFKLLCRCQHNTCGPQCERCCPGFVQKKWKGASVDSPNVCEPCNCFGHSSECIYDEQVDLNRQSLDVRGIYSGGGVCQHCQDNTEGINCDRCKPGFYRPFGKALTDRDVCQPCNCDLSFSTGNCADGTGQCECQKQFLPPHCDKCNFGYYDFPECKPCDCHMNGTYGPVCEVGGGQCPCKPNYRGKNCDQCAEGYYGFPACLACACNNVGSLSEKCDIESGQCSCKSSFGGRQCDRCDVGFFNYPDCQYCSCDKTGCIDDVCDNTTGTCLCKREYGGPRCDQCAPGYFGYPHCTDCGCNLQGSVSSICDNNGRCRCLMNFSGQKCVQCSPGYYNYPDCHNCNCDPSGAIGISCEGDGRCSCKPNFDGEKCDKCKEGFYNYPLCEDCNCNPAGVLPTFAGCGSLTSGELCECKERVFGRICNQCKPLYWNLKANNALGCEECECFKPGTMGSVGVCEGNYGQCICKPNVASRQCDHCRDGFFELDEDNLFGCEDCRCDIGGSVNSYCDKVTGQCPCRPRVTGLRCNKPLQTHYYPTLHQLQYEVEDGRTPSGTLVRFGFDENIFPNFSWRGYAIFSDIQKEVLMDIYIDKPSLYHVLLKYLNFGGENVYGSITFTPDTFSETQQSSDIVFEPTREPKFVRVSGKTGVIASPFVINPGRWSVSLKIERPLFVDYIVLLPQSYYEATLLQEDVASPCGSVAKGLCQHFSYPSLPDDTSITRGEAGYAPDGDKRINTQLYTDYEKLKDLDVGPMAWLNIDQQSLHLDIRVPKPGKYVLVLFYHTPEGGRSSNVMVDFSTTDRMDKGKAIIYDCRYSFICRQVVTDRDGKVGVFEIESNFASVTLTFEEDFSLAVESVAAIPLDLWTTDYILPSSQCVKENGVCKDRSFPRTLPEAVKVEFESGFNEDRISDDNPPNIQDPDAKMIYLDHTDPMVDVSGNVPQTGYYTFVVHYYQPHHPAFDMNVLIQNGQFYEAKLPLSHCPSRAGCRSVINAKGSNTTSFQILKNFVLSLKEPNHKSVWVDYVLAIPSDQFDESILQPEREDKAGEFLTQCGQNSFNIDTNVEGFCRDALFSLTSEYNNGALPCQCDIDGSTSFECQEFGGQCPCKPNTIGRTCSQCKTGYFGFPDCKPCSCPSTSICHPITGQCICPPRVTGEKCDTCVDFTYGLDPIIGCEECNCNPRGVYRGNKHCNITDGQCQCKSNIVGRTCHQCQAGYWSFPFCQLCNCDLRGTQEGICDQFSSDCFCKENVHGVYCDQCKSGTFFLEENNPLGCTKCFCFGATDRCSSAYRYISQIFDLEGWKLFTVDLDNGVSKEEEDEGLVTNAGSEIRISPSALGEDTYSCPNNLYIAAPVAYLGNKITSYGGNLTYTLLITVDSSDDIGSIVGLSDIILAGNNLTLVHHHYEQPVENQPFEINIRIVEREFRHTSGNEVSREQLMMVLVNLEAIYFRTCYFKPSTEISISNILMDQASEDFVADAPQAVRVEQCQCPPNYKGTSCEECSKGYYRAKTGPYLGFCIPCQCNGHSDSCDVETGECHNCLHYTVGTHCEMCAAGYHGDATQGSPYDCLICACPLPIETNNFAESCELSPSGKEISCQCQPGYYGPRCEVCAAGYYGEPEVPGSSCQRCDCSGNIDPERPGSCDSITGDCVLCLNNTFGSACELCAPGFFGDAIDRKDCEQCDCDDCGTHKCDSRDGICECKPNVVGNHCDQCSPGHYDFSSCYGCRGCHCSAASIHEQCDLVTGQCPCQPGATGRTCDVCDAGFWRYSSEGCISCNCDLKYSAGAGCDPQTGQCQCLPGVIGEKCDSCPYRWVFVKKQGCLECGPCVHSLLDETDYLRNIFDPLNEEMGEISGSYFTYKRLENVNNTVNELRPIVDEYISDPTALNLSPLEADLQDLEDNTDHVMRKSTTVSDSANQEAVSADATRIEALEVEKIVENAARIAQGIVREVKKIADGLDSDSGPNVDRFVLEAERILHEIEGKDFDQYKNQSIDELQLAQDLLAEVKMFRDPSIFNKDHYKEILDQHNRLEDLLRELRDHCARTAGLTNDANYLNVRSNNAKDNIDSAIENINEISGTANEWLDTAADFLEQAKQFLKDAGYAYETKIKQDLDDLDDAIQKLETFLENLREELSNTQPLVTKAEDHAEELRKQAALLNSLLADTKKASEAAVKAGTAYQTIVNDTEEANIEAEEAMDTAERLEPEYEGLIDLVNSSKRMSDMLLTEAEDLKAKAEIELQPRLRKFDVTVRQLEEQNSAAQRGLDIVNNELRKIPKGDTADRAQEALDASSRSKTTDTETLESVEDILNALPEKKRKTDDESRYHDDVDQAVRASNNYVSRVKEIAPEIAQYTERLIPKERRTHRAITDIADKIAELKHKVALARQEANTIKLGMRFQQNSTLQIRNPDALKKEKSATHTAISLYFLTHKSEGLLAYVGNLKKQNRKDEFLSIELRAGYVVVHMSLGGRTEQILNEKYVADGVWHHVKVERMAKIVEVTVRTEEEEDSVKRGSLQGTNIVFDVDQQNAKFYVGGVPEGVALPDDVTTRRFEGCLEELSFGDSPIGIWNFLVAQNLDGCTDRSQLIYKESSTGLRFKGTGYAIVQRRKINFERQTFISLKFKTYAANGLLFLVGKDPDHFVLEIEEGYLKLKINLGQGENHLVTTRKLNDGEWYSVEAARENNVAYLKVDGVEIGEMEIPGDDDKLATTKDIFVGGYNGKKFKSLSKTSYDGCIVDLYIAAELINLNDNKEALGVESGCPETVVKTVYFKNTSSEAYVIMPNRNSLEQYLELTFKFKTEESDGILFYVADNDQTNYVTVLLEDGQLVLKSYPGGEVRTETRYDDSEWHYVLATRIRSTLRLDIDDKENFETEGDGSLLVTTTSLYFGGVPSSYDINRDVVGSITSFKGCLGDVTLNDDFQNFATSRDKRGIALEQCPISKGGAFLPPSPVVTDSPSIPDGNGASAGAGTAPPEEPDEIIEQETPVPDALPTVETDDDLEPATPVPEVVPVDVITSTEESRVCSLPLEPREQRDIPASNGLRYGKSNNSHLQYVLKSATIAALLEKSSFSLEFKTTATDGTLLYVAGSNHVDFVGLFMRNRKIVYLFNCGSGPAEIVSKEDYNDGEWHRVEITREGKDGILRLDEEEDISGQSQSSTNSLNVQSPLYVGGVSDKVAGEVKSSLKAVEGSLGSFPGCIRKVTVREEDIGNPRHEFNVQPCSDNAEEGIFFYSDGGYITLYDKFKVGIELEAVLKVKPRSQSGVLMSVHGPVDFLVLQMINGAVVSYVDNGAGIINSTVIPNGINLCDGNWHEIKLAKTRNVLILTIDESESSGLVTGKSGINSAETNQPLYFGGVPNPEATRGVETWEPFVGCMRIELLKSKSRLRQKKQNDLDSTVPSMSKVKAHGSVNLNSCPTI